MNNKSIIKNLSVLIIGLVIAVPMSATELKGNPEELRSFLHPNQNVVSLMGEAKETAYSDKAIINLIITTEENDLANALQKNAEMRKLIISTLTSKGLKPENINTSKFSTSPQFGWFGKSPSSYEIVNRMSVAIFDEKQLVEIAKLSDAHKALELAGTTYEHTKKKEYMLKVKKKALDDALKQKIFYEKSLGVRLVTKNFRDSNTKFGATREADEFKQRIRVTGSRIKRNEALSSLAEPSAAVAQSFDEVEYKASIYIDFIVIANQ